MRFKQIWIITRKDFDEFRRNRYVFWTLFGMPILFSAMGPLILLSIPFSDPSLEGAEGEQVLNMLLAMILFFLAMIPGIVPSIVASYSFVGEKINRSMEPLLATPTTDGELLLGKSLAAFIPTMVGTYAAFSVNIVAVDIILLPIIGRLYAPDLSWIIVMFLLAPAVCIASIEANVLVSSRMRDVRAAQQVGGLIVMPLMMLLFGPMANVFQLTPVNLLIISGLFAAAAFTLFQVARRLFQREKILTQWK
jgi:ABC-type Na+ efflux pump permease subunit